MARSFGGEMMEKFAERFAERQNVAEMIGREIRAAPYERRALATDLNDADDAATGENGRGDDFLDEIARIGTDLDALKHAGMTDSSEVVDDFRAAFPRRASRNGRGAGKRYESDVAQGLGNKEIEVTPARGEAKDGDLVRLDAEDAGDAFGDGCERDLRSVVAIFAKGAGETFEFGDEAQADGHGD